MNYSFKIFLASIISAISFLLGLMFIIWATSMAFQILPYWVSVVLFFVFTLSSIVGATKLCLLNIPFLYFKIRVMFPTIFSGILILAFAVFSLWHYKELNSFYFPNWVYIVLFSAIVISTLSSVLNVPKVITLMKKLDYEVIRDKVDRMEN